MILDIHSHIIPYVDDGCRSLTDSISLIEESIQIGITHIIATPHQIPHRYENNRESIIKNFELLNEEIVRLKLPIKIFLGQEIHYLTKDIKTKLENGDLFSLNNSEYILLEFSFSHPPEDLMETIYNLNCDGYKVIVAHVERYEWINLDIILNIHNSGNYIQINDASLLGKNGFKQKKFARKLMKLSLIDYVASDMHSFRRPCLTKALRLFKDRSFINQDRFEIN